MADLTNIRLSVKASEIAKEIVDRFNFRDSMTFFQFAMAYALKNHLAEIDFDKLDAEYDSLGTNYNIGSIKKATLITTALNHIIPNCNTPYRYIRVLMIYGTYKINDRLKAGDDFSEIISVK